MYVRMYVYIYPFKVMRLFIFSAFMPEIVYIYTCKNVGIVNRGNRVIFLMGGGISKLCAHINK